MEKLQKALLKARSERGNFEAGAKPEASETGTAVLPQLSTHELWQELTPWLPHEKNLEKNRLVTSTANNASAPFDILRTKILLMMRKNGWTRLAVTSATPNCGKSFVATSRHNSCLR